MTLEAFLEVLPSNAPQNNEEFQCHIQMCRKNQQAHQIQQRNNHYWWWSRWKQIQEKVKTLGEKLEIVCDELMSIELRQVEKFDALIDHFENE